MMEVGTPRSSSAFQKLLLSLEKRLGEPVVDSQAFPKLMYRAAALCPFAAP